MFPAAIAVTSARDLWDAHEPPADVALTVLDRTANTAPAIAETGLGGEAPRRAPRVDGCGGPRPAAPRRGASSSRKVLEPDAAHRPSQHRGPARAGHQHSLPVAIPRRPDRRARAEPAGAGRDHRGRDRGVGHRRDRQRSRSIPTSCSSCRPAKATARKTSRCSALEFPINPERVAPVLRRLVLPTRTQARIYDRDGALLLDTRNLYGRGDVLRFDLIPPDDRPTRLERAWIAIKNWFGRGDLPLYRDLGPANGKGYPEVEQALAGHEIERGARERARRDHRAGRGADPALPRRARRAAALHAGRRNRLRRSRPSGCRCCCCSLRSAP